MRLEFWALPAANDGFVICQDSEMSSIDVCDEMSDGVLDGHQFSNVCGVTLLFWFQRFAPESKWSPLSINKLVQ